MKKGEVWSHIVCINVIIRLKRVDFSFLFQEVNFSDVCGCVSVDNIPNPDSKGSPFQTHKKIESIYWHKPECRPT